MREHELRNSAHFVEQSRQEDGSVYEEGSIGWEPFISGGRKEFREE